MEITLLFIRTTSNIGPKPTFPTASTSSSGSTSSGLNGDEIGESLELSTSSNNSTPKASFHEIGESKKPKVHVTKKREQQDEFQERMLQLVEGQVQVLDESDDIDLALQAVGKRMKRHLDTIQRDDMIDEMQQLVSHFIKASRNNPGNSKAIPTMPQMQPAPVPPPVAESTSGTGTLPTMPQLQRMDAFHYDVNTNQTYYNM